MPCSVRFLACAAALAAALPSLAAAADKTNVRPDLRPAPVIAAPLAPAAPAPGELETPDEMTARLNATIKARLDAAKARDDARDAAYAANVRAYEAQKKADAEAYAAAQADYEAEKAAVEARRTAELAAWEAQVKACKAGDRSQCAQK